MICNLYLITMSTHFTSMMCYISEINGRLIEKTDCEKWYEWLTMREEDVALKVGQVTF